MNFNIPDFVPVPSAETMQIISIASLVAGICFILVGVILLFWHKRKEKKSMVSWICIGVGSLLIANHGIQLLF